MFKIVLDAGHGMNTPGKRCLKSLDANETREWCLNSRICNKIMQKLKTYTGYEVLRVDDISGNTDVPLKTRTDLANEWGADIYLSIHHDAGANGSASGGITTFVYTSPSAKSEEYQMIIYSELIRTTGLKGNRALPKQRSNLHVCRESKMPAVLVECGFIDSSTDVPVILTDKYAELCADGFVNAIVKIGNLKRETGNIGKALQFADIKGHYAEQDIRDLVEMGIINGRTKDRYEPDEVMTRGEVAVALRRAVRYITGK